MLKGLASQLTQCCTHSLWAWKGEKPANCLSVSAFTLAYLCFYPNFQFSTISAMKEPSVQANP